MVRSPLLVLLFALLFAVVARGCIFVERRGRRRPGRGGGSLDGPGWFDVLLLLSSLGVLLWWLWEAWREGEWELGF